MAQGSNFGIGFTAAADTGNVVEDNTIIGNANGIFLTTGVQGNTFLRNLIEGNPPVQVSLDSPSSIGYDIKNLGTADANTFEGNLCLSAINAPCSAVSPSLTANPNPIPVSGGAIVGQTTITWSAPDVQFIEIHVGSPSGPLFTYQGNHGSLQTGDWVGEGTTFFLQDVTGGKPLTADSTLATVVVHLQKVDSAGVRFRGGPGTWAGGLSALLAACFLRRRAVVVAGTFLLACVAHGQFRAPATSAALDRMLAAHKSQREMAQYVFDSQSCNRCHTAGANGKLGFTARGTETAKGFEGCIAMLTAVSHIASVPTDQRSPQQKKKLERFDEFGCTFCHEVAPGKRGTTALGAKLANLHLGCVEIEKSLATGR